MTETVRGSFLARWIVVEPPDPEERMLILDLEVNCPQCGTGTLRLAGHHLAALGQAMDQIRQQHPELIVPAKDAKWSSANYELHARGQDPSRN